MIILITNIIQEFLSTNKTIAVVKGHTFLAAVLKVMLLIVSTLSTALVVGSKIDKTLLTNLMLIALGTAIGSFMASWFQAKKKKPKLYKFLIKFITKENSDEAKSILGEHNIDCLSIGSRTIIAYSNNVEESRLIKNLSNMEYYEATVVQEYDLV